MLAAWLLVTFSTSLLEDGFSHFEAKVCSKRKLLHLFTHRIKTQKLQSWQLRIDHAGQPLLSVDEETMAQKRLQLTASCVAKSWGSGSGGRCRFTL